MGYVPIFLNVAGRPCVVIGNGEVAEEKVRALLAAGAKVTLVGSAASLALTGAAERGELHHVRRNYAYGDLRGNLVAYVTADDHDTVQRAEEEARELGILLNVTDHPERSTFISPAVVRHGDLQIAISTGGASPAVARKLREQMQQRFGPEYRFLLEVMRRARHYVRSHQSEQSERARMLNSLAESLLNSVHILDDAHIDDALKRHLGVGLGQLRDSDGEPEPVRAPSGGHTR